MHAYKLIDDHNRRRFIRHPTDLPVTYRQHPVDDEIVNELRDISIGGISFVCPERLAVGNKLELKFPAIDESVSVIGKVTWCRIHGDEYDIGVSFLTKQDAFQARMVEQACQIELYRREMEQKQGTHISGEQAACEWISRYAENFPR